MSMPGEQRPRQAGRDDDLVAEGTDGRPQALGRAAEAAEPVFLGRAPATSKDRRRAIVAGVLLLAAFAATVPWADRPLRAAPAFVVGYNTAVIVIDLITALLLLAQYRQLGERSFLALACGYLFTPLLVAAHMLSLPGAFGPGSLVGGPQTTAWLWMGWHGLSPAFVAAYALLARRERRDGVGPGTSDGGAAAAVAVPGTVAVAAAIVLLATAGESLLPELMLGDNYRSLFTQIILAAGWAAHLVALGLLAWSTRLRRRIDVWIAMMLIALLSDLALSGVLITGRYHVGWYAGRVYGLLGVSFVLGILLSETVELYGGAVRSAADLRESRERLGRMLNTEVVGVTIFDASGTLVEANEAFLRMSGYTRKQVAARAITRRTMTPPEHVADGERQLRLLAETGQFGPYEKECSHADGSRYWLLSAGADLGDGTVVEFCIDVTDRKRAEGALKASEAHLEAIFARAAAGLSELSPSGRFLRVNDELCRMLGRSREQLLAAGVSDVSHPDDLPAGLTAVARLWETGEPASLDKRYVRPDGAVVYANSCLSRLDSPDGRPRVILAVTIDLTDRRRAEAALRESEERLRLVVESATDYAIVTLDPDRRITSWSPGARAIFGHEGRDVLGRTGDLLFTPEDRAAGEPEEEARTARREGRAADERWHVREDGSRFYASGVLTPLGDGGALGFVKVLRDLTDRKRMEDDLRRARDELELRVSERTAELARANEALRGAMSARTELLRRLVTAQEDERRRISRELHDGLGQELTALILGLKALERSVPEDAPGRDRLSEIERIVNRIGREAHDLAVDLRPTALDDIGLAPALSAYVARWTERTGIAADFRPLGLDEGRLPPEVETTVYRVVQEALNNVVKHAGARRVSVIAARRGGELTALVEDDGRGFDPGRVGWESGGRSLGLLGMRERLGLVGGTLVIDSGEGEGTTVRARIPLDQP